MSDRVKISAVLLAAGESKRMGELKQLLKFGERTFVECCVDNLLAARTDEIIVVTGHRGKEVRDRLKNRPVEIVHNVDYQIGMSTSIKSGVAATRTDASAVLIALVDQPQIETAVINRVIEAFERTRPLIVVPTYEGRKGHPIVLSSKLRGEILAMDDAQGLRQIVHAHEDETARVPITDESVLIDFDYPEDYRRLSDR